VGPSLVYQYPAYLSEPQFKSVCDILIPRQELCGKVISVQLPSSDYLVGMPVVIVSDKYERQKIEFNLALCIPMEEYEYLHVYEGIARKMAMYLTTLEQEASFISTPEKQVAMEGIVEEMFSQLTMRRECYIDVDPFNFIALKLNRKPMMTEYQVHSWQVPVPIGPLADMIDDAIDLTMRHILPLINGVYYIKEIARISQTDEALVKSCIRQLIHCKVVALVDVFQFSNTYIVRDTVREVLLDLGAECLANIEAAEDVSTADLFAWYSAMNFTSIEALLSLHPEMLTKVNIKKFVIFGVIRGIIRKRNRYFVAKSEVPVEHREALTPLLDGTHSLDEICCNLELCAGEVEHLLSPICDSFTR
jgi:hypothetical protein